MTRTDLGNKDKVLGQPWLFSHSTRIDYVHDMGIMLQLWEDGDRKGCLILINLPLMKAPRNVMPVNLRRSCETCSGEVRMLTSLANPGDDCNTEKVPEFMGCVVESLEMVELDSRKPRPPSLNEDLLLELVLSSPFFVEAIKKAWFIYAKRNGGMLAEHIQKLKENVGISLIYESNYTT